MIQSCSSVLRIEVNNYNAVEYSMLLTVMEHAQYYKKPCILLF